MLEKGGANPRWFETYLATQEVKAERGVWFWLIVSIVLNSLSLLSLTELYLPTQSSLSVVTEFYRYPFGSVHNGTPILPAPLPQLLIIMGGFFAAANGFTIDAEGTNIINCLKHSFKDRTWINRWWLIITRAAFIYASGPVVFLFLSIRSIQRGTKYLRYSGLEIAFDPTAVVKYYLFILLLNIGLVTFFYSTGI